MGIKIGNGQIGTASIRVADHQPFNRFYAFGEIPFDLTFSLVANGLIKKCFG